MKKRLAVFVSGGGTDFQAIIDGVHSGEINAEIVLCVASRADIFAVQRATQNDIRCEVFSKADYGEDTNAMFAKIANLLDDLRVDFAVLAGYLTILPPFFVKRYRGKIINIHPSLIPKYCGDGFFGSRVHEAVIASGDTESGATVHYVDEGVDTGDIIAQGRVPVLPQDTPQTLAKRVLQLEHKLLPQVLKSLCEQKEQKYCKQITKTKDIC